ncbi:MAG: NAD-dependent epimerase/dehydratase [Candidatus Peregrinibacteria bacterium GW2011_GWE2_39_6]|nr:MAG: NAD-dependent epimerase/dehydratase [Candidatus Peregrinibacteria bacterium GW2011_GWE2_39_6]
MSLLNININISEEEKRIRPSKSEVNRLICNNKKILTHTTWRPQYTLLEGLEKTIEFIKTHQKYYKNEIYNI